MQEASTNLSKEENFSFRWLHIRKFDVIFLQDWEVQYRSNVSWQSRLETRSSILDVFRVSSFESRVSSIEFWVSSIEFQVSSIEFRVSGTQRIFRAMLAWKIFGEQNGEATFSSRTVQNTVEVLWFFSDPRYVKRCWMLLEIKTADLLLLTLPSTKMNCALLIFMPQTTKTSKLHSIRR